jgi:hypothetical protein
MMVEYRPLRGVIFFYDLLRLIAMIELAVLFALPVDGSGETFFPLLVYMSPNALFPLMALLFWLRPGEHKPCLFLYIAGKIVGIAANLGWLVFSYRNIMYDLITRGDFRFRLVVGSALALGILDGLSVLGGFLLKGARTEARRIEGGGNADYTDRER